MAGIVSSGARASAVSIFGCNASSSRFLRRSKELGYRWSAKRV
jgi:hypothetical protein